MQLSLELSSRVRFRPRWWGTLLAVVLVPAFVSLGQWQLGKARAKEASQSLLEERGHGPAVQVPAAPIRDVEPLRLRPVSAYGEYEANGQILIDNRVWRERAGYHVLTPLRIEGSDMRVLVNRGWIPANPDRRHVPRPAVPAGPLRVEGTAVVPSAGYYQLAPDTAAAGGGAVWQNLDLERYRREAGVAVQPVVILLAPDSAAGGFQRDWPRLDERHERHRSYAYQWFGFAIATVAIWLYFAFRTRP